MKYSIISFRSVTYAQRAERVLNRAGIGCMLHRTPKKLQVNGCGYSLRLRTADAGAAVALLRENGVPISKVFEEKNDGSMEERAL